MLWLFPFMFAISGVSFPLGVMTYWLVSNFWTMGQQFVVIKNMPTPGSLAYDQRQSRLEAKGKLPKPEIVEVTEIEPETKGQRQQPVSKKRKKK
jgi:YidC/Oxa1 family membrane protein insertase